MNDESKYEECTYYACKRIGTYYIGNDFWSPHISNAMLFDTPEHAEIVVEKYIDSKIVKVKVIVTRRFIEVDDED